MKILGLYNNDIAIPLFDWLKDMGHEVVLYSGPLDEAWCKSGAFDLTVSYTYRYILNSDVVNSLNNNVVNLHNSFLPFNRGADPNIWSMIDGTPRGVTLHFVNAELDKGDIISQKIVLAKRNDTFASSYDALDTAAKELFKESFEFYDYWDEMRKRPMGCGNYHSSDKGEVIKKKLVSYDMKVTDYIKNVLGGGIAQE